MLLKTKTLSIVAQFPEGTSIKLNVKLQLSPATNIKKGNKELQKLMKANIDSFLSIA